MNDIAADSAILPPPRRSEPCKLYSIDDYVVWNGDRVDAAEKASMTASIAPPPDANAPGAVGSTVPVPTAAPAAADRPAKAQ